jgi:hypothetical protein
VTFGAGEANGQSWRFQSNGGQAVASAAVMRGQGLNWGTTSAMILRPLALLAAARWASLRRRGA